MIDINWSNDERNTDVNKYLVDPDNDNESRRKAFLGGWTRHLNQESSSNLNSVRWVGLGMVYASILRDIQEEQKKEIYRLLLSQYITSERVQHWTAEQRRQVMQLVTEM
jgi:short-subunit dehydrogenase